MRFYSLLNFQHVILYLLPTLLFILIFGMALAYSHFHNRDSEERKRRIYRRYPEEIDDREAPIPLNLILVIGGTLLWLFFYIFGTGLLGVKI